MPACLSTLRRKFRSPNAAFPTLQQIMVKAKESRGRPQMLPLSSGTHGKDRYTRGIFSSPKRQKNPLTLANQGLIGIRQRLILPGRVQPSTFSTGELNCCVRDGNRWNLSVIATGNGSYLIASTFSSCFHFTYLRLKEKGRRPPHPDNCTSNDSSDRSN